MQRRRVGADWTARGKAGSVRGEVLLSLALAQIGKPSNSSGWEEITRERGGIDDLYIYLHVHPKPGRRILISRLHIFVESRIIRDCPHVEGLRSARSQPGKQATGKRPGTRDQGDRSRVAMHRQESCRILCR